MARGRFGILFRDVFGGSLGATWRWVAAVGVGPCATAVDAKTCIFSSSWAGYAAEIMGCRGGTRCALPFLSAAGRS